MNRQTRTLVVVTGSLVLAAVATFAIFRFVQQMPARQVEVPSANVVAAAETIPVGTLIEERHLRIVAWPARNPVVGAVSDPKELIGRGAVTTIAVNEPVTLGKVAGREAGSGMPPVIPSGMRAMSVRVNEVIGVAGFVVPGTRVDVVVTVTTKSNDEPMTRTVVSNVQVLTAGTKFDQDQAMKEGKPIESSVVTLMVLPEDGERIALAQNEGKLNLFLRNPLDVQPTTTQGIRMASLLSPSGSQAVIDPVANRVVNTTRIRRPAPVVEAPVVPAAYRVETIRAAKRGEEEVVR
jgi:pilus assembly protein CpaB